jgi:hypothetical protein
MTSQAFGDRLDEVFDMLEPIGLDELVATAELQTRNDHKYLVPTATLRQLIAESAREGRILTIDGTTRFRYRSTYFDSPRLDSYLGSARRRPSRFKVRTRHYLDSGLCMLEVKTRDRRGQTVKHREPCDPSEENGLSATGEHFIAGMRQIQAVAGELSPTLRTNYRRATVLLSSNGAARITIDTGLWWQTDTEMLSVESFALVETKTAGKPCAFDRALWRSGHRPTTISKYCTGLAAIRPELPANRWSRVLRQHLNWQSERSFATTPASTVL